MTKDNVKLLCETHPKMQWWAMVLFAEIMDLFDTEYATDADLVLKFVRQKVEEFPRLVIQEVTNQIKEKWEAERAADTAEAAAVPEHPPAGVGGDGAAAGS